MNMQFHSGPSNAEAGVLVALTILIGIASAIFWMVVGWRAMRAHEQMAECCDGWLRIRREERINALRERQGTTTSPTVSAEDKFTPHKDAPPEFPWSKEV